MAAAAMGRSQQEVWAADFERVAAALKPYVVVEDDGFQGIGPDAPADLVSAHLGLTQMGYAQGWFDR